MTEDGSFGNQELMNPPFLSDPGQQNYGYSQTQNNQIPQEILQMYLSQSFPTHQKPAEFSARGTWTQQEDEQLLQAVHQLGPKKWVDIAKFVPTRTSKQCRERWSHRLDPEIRHEPFEPWEDQIIITKQREIGNKWAIIAQSLPGRSASAVKNRWYSGLKNYHATHAQMNIEAMTLDTSRVSNVLDDSMPTSNTDL